MGLNLICNDKTQKCGSYSSVQQIRYLLLLSLKDYLEMEVVNEIDPQKKDMMVEYIINLIVDKNKIDYQKENNPGKEIFNIYNIAGFFPFIFHSDSQGSLNSFEAKEFMETYELVEDYIPDQLKNTDGTFYLNSIFEESIDSFCDIYFC